MLLFKQIKQIVIQNLALTIALILTAIVYSKFLFFGHISWDDPEMVFKNKFVTEFDFKALMTNHFVGNYIPVTMVWHAFTWLLFENADWAHHLMNILFHLINGVLVFKLGKQLFKNDFVANIGAIIFLLHPLQVESVGWISELKNVLSTTFYLLGMIYYLKVYKIINNQKLLQTKTDEESEFKKTTLSTYKNKFAITSNYALCLLFFVLGCLSKSSVVIFPLTLMCLDIFFDKKVSLQKILKKTPFILLAIVFGIINIKTQTADLFINHAHEFPFYQRIGFAGFALFKYLILFLFPVKLSVIYPYPETSMSVFVIGYLWLLLIVGLIFFFIWRQKYTLLSMLLFITINLMLVLQLLPFGEVLNADRYMYVPIIGIAWWCGYLLSTLKLKLNMVSLALVFVLSLFSFSRASVWQSSLTLYENILNQYPNSFIALNSASVENMFLNNNEKALEYINKAIIISPKNYKGYYNRGLLYLKNKQADKAIKSFNQALELYNYSKAYVGRASAYYQLSDFPKAINDANRALKLNDKNAKAHFVLGNCYNDLNRLDEALDEYNKCIAIDNAEADFYFKRAIVYGKKQDFITCLNEINICLNLNANYFEAYYWRGVAKINLKQSACDDFKIAAQKNYQPAINAFNNYCR